MRALRQGALDGLCGIYALVNVLELVGVRGRRSSIHEGVFDMAVGALPHPRLMAGLTDGLEADDLIQCGDAAYRWLARSHGIKLSVERMWPAGPKLERDSFFQQLKEQAQETDQGVIANFHTPSISHWSVVSSIKGYRMGLRDSEGRSALELHRFDVDRGAYSFSGADTLVVRRT